MDNFVGRSDLIDGNLFVATPEAAAALRTINALRRTGKQANYAECQLLMGPSGAGKTSIIRRFLRDFPAEDTPTGLVQRVLYVESPTRCATKPLAEAILAALEDPNPARGTEAEMVARIIKQLAGQRTELLIIDEVNHVVAQSRAATYESANFFKRLLNQTRCPILFAGLPEAFSLMENEQLERRSRAVIRLEPYDWFKDGDCKTFRSIIRAFEQHFPPHIASCDLSARNTAARLHFASLGLMGLLHRLLRSALLLTDERRLGAISLELLGEIYEDLALGFSDQRARCNPFRVKTLPDRWGLPTSTSNATRPRRMPKAARAVA
ncbi:MAG: hypothetical protein BroJett029_05470 [Alphaproteobacteria bacterium]|nr:MAG: hypothetical protein BroJett029_05470 [Alphaproteobacteria bacterium]